MSTNAANSSRSPQRSLKAPRHRRAVRAIWRAFEISGVGGSAISGALKSWWWIVTNCFLLVAAGIAVTATIMVAAGLMRLAKTLLGLVL